MPVHTCAVCNTVKTAHDLETACGQVEHIKINYDANTNEVRPHADRTHVVFQYDAFLIGVFFLNVDILLKNATEIVVVRKLSVQNLDRAQSTRLFADCAQS